MSDTTKDAESFMASDTDPSQWTPEDHEDVRVAQQLAQDMKNTYSGSELQKMGAMFSTRIGDGEKGLGDSRTMLKAAARAARRIDLMLAEREGTNLPDGRPGLKFNMAMSQAQRMGIIKEAQAIFAHEIMVARSEYIRKSGQPLPGWLS